MSPWPIKTRGGCFVVARTGPGDDHGVAELLEEARVWAHRLGYRHW